MLSSSHTHKHTLSLFRMLSHTCSHTHTHTHSHTQALPHTHTHTQPALHREVRHTHTLTLLGENSLKLLQDSRVAYTVSIFIQQHQACRTHPRPDRQREAQTHSQRERGSPGSLLDCSRRERSEIKHITQGL